MVLKLDPALPVIWRSPTEIQVGIDVPAAIVPEVSTADEYMLSALAAGVSEPGLAMIAATAGGTGADAVRLVRALGAAVTDTRDARTRTARLVAIDGEGETAARIRHLLHGQGQLATDAEAPAAGCDLAVIVADYAIAPHRYVRWLGGDVPHLAIVFGDRWVRIGPLVEPGEGPCLYCVDRARVDADPAWPAMASQLAGRRAPTRTALTEAETAACAMRIILARLAGSSHAYRAASIRLDSTSGEVSVVPHRAHPECGCRALPGNVTALAPRAAARNANTTATARSWPA